MQTIKEMCYGMLNKKFARVIVAFVICSIVLSTFTGAAIAKYQITVVDGDVVTYIYTSTADPSKVLSSNNIQLIQGDEYEFSGFVNNRATINVNRAFDVVVTADGQDNIARMANGTVKEALEKANVALNEDDLINVSLDEQVFEGTHIVINRVTYEEVSKSTVIPYGLEKVLTPTLKNGKTKPISDGVNGEMLTKTKRTLIDGEVVDSQVISEEVVKKPIDAKVFYGDKTKAVSTLSVPSSLQLDKNGNPVNYSKKYVGKATAYSALGKRTKLVPGNVAMNLSMFPRGTKVYIKTADGSFVYGYSEVRDTGPAVNNGHCMVDLFFNSYNESVYFGAKQVEIYVLS